MVNLYYRGQQYEYIVDINIFTLNLFNYYFFNYPPINSINENITKTTNYSDTGIENETIQSTLVNNAPIVYGISQTKAGFWTIQLDGFTTIYYSKDHFTDTYLTDNGANIISGTYLVDDNDINTITITIQKGSAFHNYHIPCNYETTISYTAPGSTQTFTVIVINEIVSQNTSSATYTFDYLQNSLITFFEYTSNGFKKIEIDLPVSFTKGMINLDALTTDQNSYFTQLISNNIYIISEGIDYITKKSNNLMLLGGNVANDDNYTTNIFNSLYTAVLYNHKFHVSTVSNPDFNNQVGFKLTDYNLLQSNFYVDSLVFNSHYALLAIKADSFCVFIANLVVKIAEIKNIETDITFFFYLYRAIFNSLTPSFIFSIDSFNSDFHQYGENFICNSFQSAFDQLTTILTSETDKIKIILIKHAPSFLSSSEFKEDITSTYNHFNFSEVKLSLSECFDHYFSKTDINYIDFGGIFTSLFKML